MGAKSLILLALLTLSNGESTSKTRYQKCCKPGNLFSVVPGNNSSIKSTDHCVPAPNHARQLYADPGQQGAIPNCANFEDITPTPLSKLNPDDFLQLPFCVEILFEANTNQSVPTIVWCRSNKDRGKGNGTEIAPIPRLLDVRRCCPNNTVFSKDKKTCLSKPEFISDGNYSDMAFKSFLSKVVDVDILTISRGLPTCSGPIFTYEIPVEDIEFKNGVLQAMLPSSSGSNIWKRFTLDREHTCVDLTPDSSTERQLVARVCRSSDLCQDNSCIRKCCPEDKFYMLKSRCVGFREPETHLGFYDTFSNVISEEWRSKDFGLLVGKPCKHGTYMLNPGETWTLTSEGYIVVPGYNVQSHDDYCMDVFYNRTGSRIGLEPMFCFGNEDAEKRYITIRYTITSILEMISFVFLLLTLLVYICLPVLQNLHGKTLMCHAVSLMLAYACLALVPWVTPYGSDGASLMKAEKSPICTVLSYIMYYAFLSAFCWLNVMCFDIWRTFGRLRGNISRGKAHSRKFMIYCAYAWGVPTFVTSLVIAANETEFMPNNVGPNIGLGTCWFAQDPEKYGQLIFFTGPITIQLIANVVFFILTSVHCSKVKAEIRRVADPSDPRSKRFHADKTKLIMNVKLFVVMGISWVMEIVSFFVNRYTESQNWQNEVFYVSDVLNCLQGLLIFILFVMKPRVYQALKKRLGFDSKRKNASQASSTLQDPLRVKKSASNSTLTSSFAVSSVP